MKIKRIPFIGTLKFLWNCITKGWHKSIDKLQTTTNYSNFYIGSKVWILSEQDYVNTVLKSQHTSLGWFNSLFESFHGYKFGINHFISSGKDTTGMWKLLHYKLASSIGDKTNVINIWEKYLKKHKADCYPHTPINLRNVINSILVPFWGDFFFGIDSPEFSSQFEHLHTKTSELLKDGFHSSWLKRVPFIGHAWFKFQRKYIYNRQWNQINLQIQSWLSNSSSNSGSFFARFRSQLLNLPDQTIQEILYSNAFLSILAFDFVINVLEHSLIHSIHMGYEWEDAVTKSLSTSFFYPWRIRVAGESIPLDTTHIIQKGDYLLLDMVSSKHFFSTGPRSCIARSLFTWISECAYKTWIDFETTGISFQVDTYLPLITPPTADEFMGKYVHSRDMPILPENLFFAICKYEPNYLSLYLPKPLLFNGVRQFYDVLQMFHDPVMISWLVHQMTTYIGWFFHTFEIDINQLLLAGPETRALPLLGMIAYKLNVPFIVIRKAGKLPGKCFRVSYRTAYSESESELEMSRIDFNYGKIQQFSKVVLIDDGVSSGGSAFACWSLLKQAELTPVCFLAAIRYSYLANEKINPGFCSDVLPHTKTWFDL